ncbi:MAG: hypothetical protein COV47_01675, partial [Candidatus Diapherotrites archaeon CG11_big_fil_rev_8_21_14_0_20_37_9]
MNCFSGRQTVSAPAKSPLKAYLNARTISLVASRRSVKGGIKMQQTLQTFAKTEKTNKNGF